MALVGYDDLATFLASGGAVYTAPTGTKRPEGYDALNEPASPWTPVGHTSAENIVTLSAEGGERSTKGSLQKSNLRENLTATQQSFGVRFLEWTRETYRYYYGANVVVDADGGVQVPEKPQPVETALLIVLKDGDSLVAWYAAKASAYRDTDIEVSNTEDLAEIPVKFTALAADGSTSSFTAVPKLTKARQAAGTVAQAEGKLTAAFITDAGAGYKDVPNVTITGAGTGGKVTAKISGGRVSELTVTTPGSGYDDTTKLVIAAPSA